MIPVFDLSRQIAAIRGEVDTAIGEVLDSSRFILGPRVSAFERDFATFLGVEAVIGVGSGTDALHLALRAVGVQPGDEVITVANAGIYAAATVEMAGARPVLVDIEPSTHTIDVQAAERAINARTRAILLVHLYGGAADLGGLLDLQRRYGLKLIEDCAQSHGGRWQGRRLGSIGDVAAFSFYPTKNLGAYGDGGAIATRDIGLAEQSRLLRMYGWREQYYSVIKGTNSRLDELQAAILQVKLRHLDEWNTRRRALAARYTDGLRGVSTPVERPSSEHVYHLYVIRSARREALREHLAAHGIGTAIHYPLPAHLQEAYANLQLGQGSLPESERAATEILSLPMFPELTDTEVDRVIEHVNAFTAGG